MIQKPREVIRTNSAVSPKGSLASMSGGANPLFLADCPAPAAEPWVVARSSANARRGRNLIRNHPGGDFMPQSGCPPGFAFQNMILSK